MKPRRLNFAIFIAFLILVITTNSEGLDTRQIDIVLNKGVLNNQDLQVIDNFIKEAVQELVNEQDLTNIARIRMDILNRQSDQAQYAQQFSESTYKYISAGLQMASSLTPAERQLVVTVNLLILIDGLAEPQFAELANSKLKDQSMVVRYWAVHCLTNPGIIKKLNASGPVNRRLGRNIIEQLKGVVEDSKPEIIAMIADFAADVNIPEGEDLLLKIADMRIKRYAEWKVEYELLDGTILKLLCNNLSSTNSDKLEVARRFGQLYSYVIQRYVKGKGILSDTQKQQLVSVMVEAENKCISSLFGRTSTGIKNAIEADNINDLLQEHNKLFGDQTKSGELTLKLNIDYGTDPSGKKKIAPYPLPDPPTPRQTP